MPTDKRGHCIKEIQDTELNYVEALKMIQNKFYAPLKEILTAEDHQTIFINILVSVVVVVDSVPTKTQWKPTDHFLGTVTSAHFI